MYHIIINVPGGNITAEICYSRQEAENIKERYEELFFFCGYEVLSVMIVPH